MPEPKTAGCMIIDDDGQHVVVLYTSDGLELPKGRIGKKESMSEAAIREAEEEAGVKCKVKDLTPIMIDDTAFFVAEFVSGEVKPSGDAEKRIKDAGWVTIDYAAKNLVKSQRSVIKGYLNR